ncbi:hypothetical protein D3C73_1014090 [compost metagenome]
MSARVRETSPISAGIIATPRYQADVETAGIFFRCSRTTVFPVLANHSKSSLVTPTPFKYQTTAMLQASSKRWAGTSWDAAVLRTSDMRFTSSPRPWVRFPMMYRSSAASNWKRAPRSPARVNTLLASSNRDRVTRALARTTTSGSSIDSTRSKRSWSSLTRSPP